MANVLHLMKDGGILSAYEERIMKKSMIDAGAITPEEAHTLHNLFTHRVKLTPDSIAYKHFDKAMGEWADLTWSDMERKIRRWSAAFANEGLNPGDRVAICLANSPEWVLFDQAAMRNGLITVPLYANDSAGSAGYILRHSGARFLLIGDMLTWEKLKEEVAETPDIKRVVTLDRIDESGDDRVSHVDDWAVSENSREESWLAKPEDLVTIIYTSGTTGHPKGVMLSHHNIFSNAIAGLKTAVVTADDIFLSFLPLSHALERTIGYYLPVTVGAKVAYARSIPDLAEDLLTVRPTFLVSVPRIFERVQAKISAQLEEKPPFARKLFKLAVETGWKRFLWKQGRGDFTPAILLWPILNQLVAKKLMAKLGGRIALAISGGAPLSTSVSKTFIGLGLNLLQGYGLTETSPVIAVNRGNNNAPETVGSPLPGVAIRVGESDELQVNSPGVMLGYWKDEDATREIFTSDGFLRTGDRVCVEDGNIRIIGRLKEIIIMSTGEKAPPGDMEMALESLALVEKAIVYGEGKPFLTAALSLNEEEWKKTSETLEVTSADEAVVEEFILKEIAPLMRTFPSYARVRRLFATEEQWTIDNGLLTPTLKVKRSKISERYRNEIERLYKKNLNERRKDS